MKHYKKWGRKEKKFRFDCYLDKLEYDEISKIKKRYNLTNRNYLEKATEILMNFESIKE